MKKSALYCWSVGLALLATIGFTNQLAAKEVEIVIAGPWAYATDPNDARHVLLIVIKHDHEVHLLPGGDVWKWKDANSHFQERDSGYYATTFSTQCTSHANVNVKLYPVKQPDVKYRLDNAMSGGSIAISLPKPCWYEEGYKPSYTKLGDDLKEYEFTTIMRLHYTVDDGINELRFAGLKSPIPFEQVVVDRVISSNPSVSIVVGKTSGGPDKKCDKHSADILDRTLDFWGQARVRRLFPKLDDYGSQLNDYDMTCKPYVPGTGVGTSAQGTEQRGEIMAIPNSTHDDATNKNNVSPSRSDCHVSQFNVNGAVQ